MGVSDTRLTGLRTESDFAVHQPADIRRFAAACKAFGLGRVYPSDSQNGQAGLAWSKIQPGLEVQSYS